MRWLVGLTALISACGLSHHDGNEQPASSDGGTGGQTSAQAGSGPSAGASMLPSDSNAGAAGANVRPGGEHPGLPASAAGNTASAGNGAAAAGAATSGSTGAGGVSGTTSSAETGGTSAGGLSSGGGTPGAAAGTTSTSDDGGAGSDTNPGPSGYALHFGVQSFADELIPLFDSRLDGAWATPHTFEAWFRTQATVAPLIAAYDDTDTWGAISLSVVNGGVCFHYEVGVSPPFHDICTQTRTLNDGAWHHAALVLNDAQVRLFEDGVLALDASVDLTLPDSLDRLDLGTGTAGSEGQTVFLEGDLDEVRVWRGARTPTEIANYRATELAPSFTPDSDGNYLLAYLRLEDGTGANMLEDLGAASNRPAELNVHETAEPWITPGAF